MSVAVREEPRLLHALPGRIRVHLPEWQGDGQRNIERGLHALPGVRSVQVTPLTGNVLIRFDPAATNAPALLTALRTLERDLQEVGAGGGRRKTEGGSEPLPPPALRLPSQAQAQVPRVVQ